MAPSTSVFVTVCFTAIATLYSLSQLHTISVQQAEQQQLIGFSDDSVATTKGKSTAELQLDLARWHTCRLAMPAHVLQLSRSGSLCAACWCMQLRRTPQTRANRILGTTT